MFLFSNIFLNYDTGVIPASLSEINKEIDLNFKEQALIGSIVYIGLSFASLFVSLIIGKYGPAKTCAYALLINSLSCYLFSISKMKYFLYFCRFLMGASEAFVVIYGPVWVNNYSPPEHSAKWMGILHSVTVLGSMIGYLITGIIINFFNNLCTWRFAVQIQGFAQIPLALLFYLEKEEYINVDLSPNSNNLNTITEISESITNKNPNNRAFTPEPGIKNIDPNHKIYENPDFITKEIKKHNTLTNKFNISSIKNNIITSDEYNHNRSSDKILYLQNKVKIMNETTNKNLAAKEINLNNNIINNNNNSMVKSKLSNTNNNVLIHNLNNYNSSRSKKDSRMDSVQTNDLNKYCLQVREVVTNPMYITTTMGLCSMYFIVTGIQFWMTKYLIDVLGNDPILVFIIFSFVSITAPLGGVIMGGVCVDAYGGYKGKNSLNAFKLCSLFGLLALLLSFPIGFIYSLFYITILLWTFLFFGAAIVPVCTGIMVSSVKRYLFYYLIVRDCQATSSSFSQLIFNLFGYFFSPILIGIIMDLFEDKIKGFKFG